MFQHLQNWSANAKLDGLEEPSWRASKIWLEQHQGFCPGRKQLNHLPLITPKRLGCCCITLHAITDLHTMSEIAKCTWQSLLWARWHQRSLHAQCASASTVPSLTPGLWRTAPPVPAHASLCWHWIWPRPAGFEAVHTQNIIRHVFTSKLTVAVLILKENNKSTSF